MNSENSDTLCHGYRNDAINKEGFHVNRRISALLTVLAMVLALSACGDGKKENGQTPQEQPKQEDSMLGEGSADSGTAAPGQDDHTVTAPDTTPGKNPAAADDTRPSAGTDLEDMAEQARVHDRDGDLTDGENPVAPGADRWYRSFQENRAPKAPCW